MSQTVGTAGDGYRAAPAEHNYRPDPRTDYGERPRCVCGRDRAEHRVVKP